MTGCFLSHGTSASLCPPLRDMFGEESVDFSVGKNISVTVDGKTIHICLETRVRRKTVSVCVELLSLCLSF